MKSVDGELEQIGWTRLSFQFSKSDLDALSALNPHTGRGQRLTDMRAVREVLPNGFQNELIELDFAPNPIRTVGFVKSQQENWSLPWHQDRVIAMPEKVDDPAYSHWSRKSEILHCEPPVEVLRKVAFAYIAFDPVVSNSGGIEIAEGTHRIGKIQSSEIERRVKSAEIRCPTLNSGEALLIKALTLHRSGRFESEGQRRTLRLDFLRNGL